MGPTPCKYAVVGMGSLARNEISPYSDFEHIVIQENDQNMKGFDVKLDYKEYF